VDASVVSFLTSISPHIFFFSAFVILRCSWIKNGSLVNHSIKVFHS
jgi:hypothetical protein